MVTIDDVRAVAGPLPRSYEVVVRDRVKFRVGSIVYVAFSRDESEMGFAFPKEERAAIVAAEPAKFFLPGVSDLRFNWLCVWLSALDRAELGELVLDAWRMVVPQRVAAAHDVAVFGSGELSAPGNARPLPGADAAIRRRR